MTRNNSVSAWQVGILMFVLLLANKILMLPSLLYEDAKLEVWLVLCVLFGLEIGLVALFWRLKTKYPNETFRGLMCRFFGKIATKIFFVLVMFFCLSKALLLYNVTYIFFKSVIYKEADNLLYLIAFLPVVVHLAVSGLRVMGRTMQMFFPALIVTILFCVGVGLLGMGETPLAFQSTGIALARSVFRHVSAFGDSIFLFLIMDKVKIEKGQWKVLFLFSAFALLLVGVICMVFVFSYSYTSFMHPFALFEIMSYVKEYGGLGRIDIVAIVLIIALTYFQLALYLHMFVLAFDNVVSGLKVFYPVATFVFSFVGLVTFVVLNVSKTILFGEKVLPYFGVLPFAILPAVVIVLLFGRQVKEGGP